MPISPRITSLRSPLVLAVAICAVVGACKVAGVSDGDGTGGRSGPAGSGSGGGVSMGTPNDGGANTGGNGGPSTCSACSADLHDIVDCDSGRLLMKCPDDKGCAAGACVPACDAAKANNSAQGCEFYSAMPGASNPQFGGSCFAALITNTWTAPVTIRADYAGKPLNVAGMARTPKGAGETITYEPLIGDQLAPGQVGILFLAGPVNGPLFNVVDCPAGTQPGVPNFPTIAKSGIGNGFQIRTSAPVAAYDMYPYGGAESYISSATLLIPTSAWGTNYIAADGYSSDPMYPENGANPFVQIVAAEDGTNVTVSPTAAIVGGPGIAATGAGQPKTYTLAKGQVLQLLQPAELAGTPIASDKPIGVWGGASCMFIPLEVQACDGAHQQLVPIASLGFEYAAVRHRDRKKAKVEQVPWTLVGAVDDTVLTYDPAPPKGAPTVLKSRQVVRFETSESFTVRSSDDKHPFYLAEHMTGGTPLRDTGAMPDTDIGDPEYVNAVPPQQWLRSYVFLTDHTYTNTHLVLVRQKGADGLFKDVTLDCAGTLTGWSPVGKAGRFEFTRFDFDKKDGGCRDGAHSARSDASFGLTVWGWDMGVSYAYPGGLSTRPINNVVVPPREIIVN